MHKEEFSNANTSMSQRCLEDFNGYYSLSVVLVVFFKFFTWTDLKWDILHLDNASDGFKNNLFSACLKKFQKTTDKTLLLEVFTVHRSPYGGKNL